MEAQMGQWKEEAARLGQENARLAEQISTLSQRCGELEVGEDAAGRGTALMAEAVATSHPAPVCSTVIR